MMMMVAEMARKIEVAVAHNTQIVYFIRVVYKIAFSQKAHRNNMKFSFFSFRFFSAHKKSNNNKKQKTRTKISFTVLIHKCDY